MARPRKLLSVGHSYVVGVNRRLAHELNRAGQGEWEVRAAAPTYFHGGNDLRPIHLELRRDERDWITSLPAFFTRKAHVFLYGPALRELLSREWDVIHCWEEPYVFAGGQIALLAPRKSALIIWTAQSLNKRYAPPFAQIERFAMGRAAGWICCGDLVEKNLENRPGYVGKPHRKIPLGVDVDLFAFDAEARAAVFRSLEWSPRGPLVVGFLGRFSPDKGVPLLMSALDATQAPWRALFVGTGVLEGELRRWGQKYPDRVRIRTDVGHAQVPAHLSAMDVLCAPSQTMPNWKEQFGRMLIEGFAAGVPVIGSSSGEIPYVLEGAGRVVDEKDVHGWSAAIGDLLESPARRSEMRDRGLAVAREKYSWPVVAREYLRFFDGFRPASGGV